VERYIGIQQRLELRIDFCAPENQLGNIVSTWNFPLIKDKISLEIFLGTLFAVKTDSVSRRFFCIQLVFCHFEIAFCF